MSDAAALVLLDVEAVVTTLVVVRVSGVDAVVTLVVVVNVEMIEVLLETGVIEQLTGAEVDEIAADVTDRLNGSVLDGSFSSISGVDSPISPSQIWKLSIFSVS